ncbi:hypothetical protein [Vibrio sp.]|uniref:hypothetical protein n=1 Tax=Vibrio sp. TaxID=678 RepID=UPI003D0B2BB6
MVLNIQKKILLLSTVSLGFQQPFLFLFFTSLWLSIATCMHGKWVVNKRILFFSFILFVYVFLFYSRPDYITNYDFKNKILVFFVFFILYLFQVYFCYRRVDEPIILQVLIWSVFLKLSSICIYSFYLGGYGYGLLYDFYSGQEVNSPGSSNQLTVCLIYFIVMLFGGNNISYKQKVIYFFSLCIGIMFGFFLGGRFLFVALMIASLLLILKANFQKFIYFILFVFFVVFVGYFFFSDNIYVSLVWERFSSGGSNNLRLLHIIDGVNQLQSSPYGGFYVNRMIENTYWFHNIFLDSAKVFGFIIIIPLCVMVFSFFWLAVRGYLSGKKMEISIMSFLMLLIMMQDVVMESNFLILMIYFLFSCGLINNNALESRCEIKYNYRYL